MFYNKKKADRSPFDTPRLSPRTERSDDPGSRVPRHGLSGRLWAPALPLVGRGNTERYFYPERLSAARKYLRKDVFS